MALLDELLELERGFWHATGDPDYYRRNMAAEGLAVFGIGVMTRDEAVASTSNPDASGWTDIEVAAPRLLRLAEDCAALVYEGRAKRDGEPYVANTSSVYIKRDGSWLMALHQQSPQLSGPAAGE